MSTEQDSTPQPQGSSESSRPAEHRRPQMADLARLAGVSVATVSRALNGSTEVSEATRNRISELARQMNYTINLSAKNLRTRQNRTVAVVIPYDSTSRQHVSEPFFLTMMGSLADSLTSRGYDMLLSRVDAEKLDTAATLYDSGTAIGIIMIGQWHHHDQLNVMAARNVPLVVWGAQLAQQIYCSVGGDNFDGGAKATRHLIEQGRKRIAFLGDPDLPEVMLRHRGYEHALREAGMQPDPRLLLKQPFEANMASDAVRRLVADGAAFDALFACSDVLAVAAIHALRSSGRSVPRDVAVVGYDDVEWARHAEPPLTTIRQPFANAGAEIVDALLLQLSGQKVPPRTLRVELVVRNSSIAGGA
jgi:DNA-binding LacI/PurR family transcriptional regulator